MVLHNYCYSQITDPPRVLSLTPSGSTTIMVGDTLTLNCTYDGNPSPTPATWSHNDTILDPSSDPNLSETLMISKGYSLLEVTFADINDTGSYTCEVNNSYGNDSNTVIFNTEKGIHYYASIVTMLYIP